ncbi:hypothetical protein GCM10023321_30300 [Pseudonocardia eucalypti]|uniref:Uncharacterized protein n=1 Tax=Pseudonocardia eucalypti TaxID=648755 RepID=A0ABP9Q3S6_9PSEU
MTGHVPGFASGCACGFGQGFAFRANPYASAVVLVSGHPEASRGGPDKWLLPRVAMSWVGRPDTLPLLLGRCAQWAPLSLVTKLSVFMLVKVEVEALADVGVVVA